MGDLHNMNEFGSRIQKRRKALNMQQSELAEKLDISTNHLSTIETGKSHPSYDLLCKLCITLDVTPDYLMMGSLHSYNISKNLIDKLRLCSEHDLTVLDQIVEIIITNSER